MRSVCFVLALISCSIASAQDIIEKKKNEEQNVFTKVEIEAHTDQKAWRKYIGESLDKVKLSDSMWAKAPAKGFVVEVEFIVDKYGRVTEVKALQDPGEGLGAKAVKIVKNYPGTWKPASQCGRNVKAYRKEKFIFLQAN